MIKMQQELERVTQQLRREENTGRRMEQQMIKMQQELERVTQQLRREEDTCREKEQQMKELVTVLLVCILVPVILLYLKTDF